MTCPVCGSELVCEMDTIEGVVMEAHDRCPNNHYWFDYVTGHSQLAIGMKEWSWEHSEDGPTRAEQDDAIEIARRSQVPGTRVREDDHDSLLPWSLP